MYKLLLFIFVLLNTTAVFAQITLKNPSFEGKSKASRTPDSWSACGIFSDPDILPDVWGVYLNPQDGKTFMGLVTREDSTRESVGQKLSEPIMQGEKYTFKIHLARSEGYENHNEAIRLRVWGSNKLCRHDELLAETKLVEHTDWQEYTLSFIPKATYTNIGFEAFYLSGAVPYAGNLLLDNCSSIECTSFDKVANDWINFIMLKLDE